MSFGVQNSTQKEHDKKKEKHGHHNTIQNKKRQVENQRLLDLMLTSRKAIVISKPPRKF